MSADPADLVFRFNALGAAPRSFAFEAGPAYLTQAARDLGVLAVNRFDGRGEVLAFQGGADVSAAFSAEVVQACGVTLEPVTSRIEAEFRVRVVPQRDAFAPVSHREVEIDPFEEDPPDVVEVDHVDVGALLFEHLALEIDPFPRKPDAVFTPPDDPSPVSPFAVLKRPKA